MTHDNPDFLRNLSACAALYFGATSIYALDPSLAPDGTRAAAFALLGLWFALAAALDMFSNVATTESV